MFYDLDLCDNQAAAAAATDSWPMSVDPKHSWECLTTGISGRAQQMYVDEVGLRKWLIRPLLRCL